MTIQRGVGLALIALALALSSGTARADFFADGDGAIATADGAAQQGDVGGSPQLPPGTQFDRNGNPYLPVWGGGVEYLVPYSGGGACLPDGSSITPAFGGSGYGVITPPPPQAPQPSVGGFFSGLLQALFSGEPEGGSWGTPPEPPPIEYGE